MELIPFGMDEGKEYCVIFKIENEDGLNAYLWVYDNGAAKLTDIYGLVRYCTHAVSAVYVGEIPEEQIEEALQKLSEIPEDRMKEMVDDYNERMRELKEHESAYEELKKYEDSALSEIEKGNTVDGMFWFD